MCGRRFETDLFVGKRNSKLENILIVEDDIHIGNAIEEALTGEGYGVFRAYSGTEAVLFLAGAGTAPNPSQSNLPQRDPVRRNLSQRDPSQQNPARQSPSQQNPVPPDLVLLDLMLPGLGGEEVLAHIRELWDSRGIPVIVMSARADVDSKVDLLLGGAVDYVTKPFQMKELLARIAAHLRAFHAEGQAGVLRFGDIRLCTDIRRAVAGDTDLRLTRTEYAILKLLMENQTRVLTKSVLLDRISLDTPDCTENSLKMHVSNLRKKLKSAGCRDCIEAVWGIGFQLKEEQDK